MCEKLMLQVHSFGDIEEHLQAKDDDCELQTQKYLQQIDRCASLQQRLD